MALDRNFAGKLTPPRNGLSPTTFIHNHNITVVQLTRHPSLTCHFTRSGSHVIAGKPRAGRFSILRIIDDLSRNCTSFNILLLKPRFNEGFLGSHIPETTHSRALTARNKLCSTPVISQFISNRTRRPYA